MHVKITGPREQIHQLLEEAALPTAGRRDMRSHVWIEADWSEQDLSTWPAMVGARGCKVHITSLH